MLRILAHRFGSPFEVLSCESAPAPVLEPTGVVVRMLASTINPSDLITISGVYQARTSLPFVPGFEGVGIVEQIGCAVTGLHKGQRVLPLGSAGGWQTYKSVPAEWCVSVPDDLTDEQAATAYINPLTALLMLRSMQLYSGQVIGINAANSAIGRILLRMASARGIRCIAIVRSSESRKSLRDEPTEAIALEGEPLPLLDGGLDAIGGKGGRSLVLAIKPGGILTHYGLLSGEPLAIGQADKIGAQVRPFWLRNWVHSVSRKELENEMGHVFADIRTGIAKTVVEARYGLPQMHHAFLHNGKSGRRGKILLIPTEK